MTVDFATYCCPKDREKLYNNFKSQVDSHQYKFDNLYVIHQRCKIILPGLEGVRSIEIKGGQYTEILRRNGINPNNKEADDYTHVYLTSSQLAPVPMSTVSGTERSSAPSISSRTIFFSVSSSSGGLSKTSSSWICSSIRARKFSFFIRA